MDFDKEMDVLRNKLTDTMSHDTVLLTSIATDIKRIKFILLEEYGQ